MNYSYEIVEKREYYFTCEGCKRKVVNEAYIERTIPNAQYTPHEHKWCITCGVEKIQQEIERLDTIMFNLYLANPKIKFRKMDLMQIDNVAGEENTNGQ